MSQISLSIPQIGVANATEDVKVANDFTTIQNVINGNLDATNISALLAQSATVNQAGQAVKGASVVAGPETRTNTAYGLMPTADQVTGIVLPTNGLIAVWYQATWQESVSGAASAAIFIGANQLKFAQLSTSPQLQNAQIGGTANTNVPLATWAGGLFSGQSGGVSYAGDVTTGQVVGLQTGTVLGSGGPTGSQLIGGPCYIDNLPAGTYTISVQFKAGSGGVTRSNGRLRALALSFT